MSSDQHALCWLLTKKDLTGRLARWSLWCQEHNLKIVHKSGKLHTDADALSRHPIGEEPKEEEEFENVMIFSLQTKEDSSEALKAAQRKFAKWGRMIEKLENGILRGYFQLINGALFTLPTRATETYPRLCLV